MRNRTHSLFMAAVGLGALLLIAPYGLGARGLVATAQAPDIGVNGFFASDKAQRGSTVQAAVVLRIPSGYHINSNRPLASFLIPTSLKIDAPRGVRVGAVSYPRAQLRNFSFSQEKLSVYEGLAVLRFNVTVPQNFSGTTAQLRLRLRFQSCNEEACFPPTSREIELPIGVVGPQDPVKRINNSIFGGRKR